MAFHDVRLPTDIERGAQGGPGFKTTVLSLSSGYEKRNIDWERTRGKWDISYGLDSKANQEAVLAFFYARQGRAHSFRFKDWTDFEIGESGSPQEIATADGMQTQFQIVRRYTSGAYTFSRAITRPVSGTVQIYVNGMLQGGGVSVDVDTGVITFVSAPSMGDTIEVICEFDVPVRFDTDQLDMRAFWAGNFSLPALNLIEVRETLQTLS